MIKSKLTINFDDFKIVEGDDIVKYYNGNMYVDYADETVLGQSCMRHKSCKNYIKFYAINKKQVKLVIMFGKNDDDTMSDKIAGRALLWTLDSLGGEPTDRLFMDRIYATNDVEVDMFKVFAKTHLMLDCDYDYVFWADADIVFKKPITEKEVTDKLLPEHLQPVSLLTSH